MAKTKFNRITLQVTFSVFAVLGASGCWLQDSGGSGEAAWAPQTSGTTLSLNAVECKGSACFAAGEGGVILKAQAGAWNPQVPSDSAFPDFAGRAILSLAFEDALTGYAVAGASVAWKTSDGGATWRAEVVGNNNLWARVQVLPGEQKVGAGIQIRCGTGGCNRFLELYGTSPDSGNVRTIARGADTSELELGDPAALHFVDSLRGYVAQANYVHKTVDGGMTWSSQALARNIRGLQFLDVNTGYAVGDSGFVAKTNNGGVSWTTLSAGTRQNLRGLRFANASIGHAVGDSGTLVTTVDGGATWKRAPNASIANLRAVALFDGGATGYAVGDDGTILKLSNGPKSKTR